MEKKLAAIEHKSKRSYGFLITKELIFDLQILDLKDHFSASLNNRLYIKFMQLEISLLIPPLTDILLVSTLISGRFPLVMAHLKLTPRKFEYLKGSEYKIPKMIPIQGNICVPEVKFQSSISRNFFIGFS